MEFKFIEDPISKHWVISAPRRAKRPSAMKGTEPVCPFCIGQEKGDEEVYRIPARSASTSVVGGSSSQTSKDWKVRVVKNAFPFAPIHEIIIHSPDHHKSFDELPITQTQLIIQAFKQRYLEHKDKGSVYIFTNHGEAAGESLPHPHSQLVVIPDNVKLDLPHQEIDTKDKTKETDMFTIFCPYESKWPDEVWIYPKRRSKTFGEINEDEIKDVSKLMYRLIQIMDLRHGHEFPYNLCIYPYKDWYMRLVPRAKVIGGFEVGTGVFVNTQEPKETMDFIIEHFDSPDIEKIKSVHRAKYSRHS